MKLLLFPGQGAQHAFLGKHVFAKEPGVLNRANEILCELGSAGQSAMEVISRAPGPPVLSAKTSQALLYAVQVSIGEWLCGKLDGNDPGIIIGYSAGELPASVVSGLISMDSGMAILKERFRSLDKAPKGGMLAIRLPSPRYFINLPEKIEIAATNDERNIVLCGEKRPLEELSIKLRADKVFSKFVDSDIPFHHSSLSACVDRFSLNEKIERGNHGPVPLYSSFDGRLIGENEVRNPEYWSNHPIRKLNLPAAVKNISRRYVVNEIIELGPANSLANFTLNAFKLERSKVKTI